MKTYLEVSCIFNMSLVKEILKKHHDSLSSQAPVMHCWIYFPCGVPTKGPVGSKGILMRFV